MILLINDDFSRRKRMVNLTETAVQKLKEVLRQGNITDQGVRIFVSAGG